MARLWQVVWQWSGTSGGAGYTNLFYESTADTGTEALAAVNKSRILFQMTAAYLPTGVNVTPQTDVRLIEDSTGNLINIYTASGVAPVTGIGGTEGYAAASGACIDWLTGVIHGKHLMVGRTFLVPLFRNVYEANGSLSGQVLIDITSAAETMRTFSGPPFGVWGRPRKAHTKPDGTVVPALSGLFARAISERVPDKAVVLRSRRD